MLDNTADYEPWYTFLPRNVVANLVYFLAKDRVKFSEFLVSFIRSSNPLEFLLITWQYITNLELLELE